jgi:hypothetical protein
MDHGKKKSSRPREVAPKQRPLGLVITVAVAVGIVIGSAATYVLTKPLATATPALAPAAGASVPLANVPAPSGQPQYTPAPQPPGEVPPGKVWSVEHGHWHDAPAPAVVAPVPGLTPVPGAVPK